MKNNIIIALFLLLVSSCDVLELKPTDIYGIDNYWVSKINVERFMSGLHQRIRNRQFVLVQMGEFRGGYLKPGPNSTVGQSMNDVPILSNKLSVQEPGVSNFGAFYTDIMQINHAIENISVVTFLTNDEKNYYLGMLHGMRSFYYFHLFRTWGGMPLREKADVLGKFEDIKLLNMKRSTERETYKFILDDVNKSIEYFATDNFTQMPAYKCSFWTKQATYMLKAEVLLWGAKVKPIGESTVYSTNPTQDFNDVITLLRSIESKTALQNTMEDLYQKKDNPEIIFSIRYALNEAGHSMHQFLYPPESFGTKWKKEDGSSLGDDPLNVGSASMRYEYNVYTENRICPQNPNVRPSYGYDLYSKFTDGAKDIRRDYAFLYFYNITKTGRPSVTTFAEGLIMRKFLGNTFVKDARNYVDDYPIYRKADLLLMLAEAYNELNDKTNTVSYINQVRKRAYSTNWNVATYGFTYQNKDQAEEAILEERDKEFVAEGKRWYDIRRMLNAKYALPLVGNVEGKLLWPIDPNDMSKDPLLEQNPAYK